MKKNLLKVLSVLLLVPNSVLADVASPEPSLPGSSLELFPLILVTMLAVVVIVVIYTVIKNKKGKK